MIVPAVRDVLRLADSGRRERLIWVEAPKAAFFFIDIDAESASPLLRRREEIEALIGEGLVAPTEDPWLRPMLESALSPAQKEKRDAAWAAIQPLVADQPMVFDPGESLGYYRPDRRLRRPQSPDRLPAHPALLAEGNDAECADPRLRQQRRARTGQADAGRQARSRREVRPRGSERRPGAARQDARCRDPLLRHEPPDRSEIVPQAAARRSFHRHGRRSEDRRAGPRGPAALYQLPRRVTLTGFP